jgi:LacI family transcriptional regulator
MDRGRERLRPTVRDIARYAGVSSATADLGLAPGRDVAVIGFDNLPEGVVHRPALTIVAIGALEIGGRRPARCFVASNRPKTRPLLPPKLVIRSSCGEGSQ